MTARSGGDAPRVLLSVEEAAEVLSIGRTAMYAYLKAGLVASVKLGHRRFVPADAITGYVTWLTAQTETPPHRPEGSRSHDGA